MRIPSGVTDQYIYFVAVDSTDLKTRETGLTTFTVYRSRNGGAAAAYTTPTVNETDATNMPGVYELLLDEDMTIDSGDDSQEVVLHITQASMAPVTRTFELYRPKITAGNTLDVTTSGNAGIDWGNVENATSALNLSGTNIDTDQVVASVTGAVGSVTGAVGSVSAGGITASSLAADTITAAKVAADVSAEIADAVWDEALAGHAGAGSAGEALSAAGTAGDPWTTALPGAYGAGTAGYIIGTNVNATVSSRASQTSVDTIDDFLDTEVAAIKTKTDFLPSATAGDAGGLFIAGTNAATSITTALTANITGNVTGNLSGSVGSVTGNVGGSVVGSVASVTATVNANMLQISGDTTAADNLELALDDTAGAVPWLGIIDQGTAQSATATTVVLRSAAAFADDTLIGATIAVLGSTQGYWQTRVITDHVLSTDTVTVDTWTVTPSGTITYKIFATPPASATSVPAVNLVQVAGSTTDVSALATNVAAILVDTGTTLDGKLDTIDNFLDTEVAAILADTNELQTDWANGGRLDLLLDGAASAGDPWTTSLPGAYGAGTAGYIVGTNVNATVSSRASQTSVDTVDTVVDAILVDTGTTLDSAISTLTTNVATVDTVVDAVKAKTDSLTFTTAGQVDANIQSLNDAALTGDGTPGTPWGPA